MYYFLLFRCKAADILSKRSRLLVYLALAERSPFLLTSAALGTDGVRSGRHPNGLVQESRRILASRPGLRLRKGAKAPRLCRNVPAAAFGRRSRLMLALLGDQAGALVAN